MKSNNCGQDVASSSNDVARKRVLQALSCVNALVFVIFFYWLTTYRTWQFDESTYFDAFGGNFYWLQARAILDGHIWLNSQGFECIIVNGHCHGYFGPLPSLLRIPFAAFFGNMYEGLSPIFMSLAAGISFFAFANLCTYINFRSRPHNSRKLNLIGVQVLFMGFGVSSVLVLSAHPRVYEEAVLWSVALTSVAINLAYRWFEERRTVHLSLIMLCGCGAVLSRATSQPFFLVLGLVIFIVNLKSRNWKNITASLSIALVPLAVLATYSLANIGVIGFDATKWYAYNNNLIVKYIIDNNNGATLGLHFLPTVIANHLRVTNLSYHLTWPFVSIAQNWNERSTYISPIEAKNMFMGYSPGLIAIVPGTVLFAGVGMFLLTLKKRSRLVANRFGLTVISIASLGIAAMSMAYFAVNARYLTDLYPLLSVGLLIFSARRFSSETKAVTKIAVMGLFLVFSLYSLVALIVVYIEIYPML